VLEHCKYFFTRKAINQKRTQINVNKNQRLTIIILIGVLITAIILSQEETEVLNSEENKNHNENIVSIAVTYEKLAENVMLWPHPVQEEKIIALINLTQAEVNEYCIQNQIDTQFTFIPTPVIHKGSTASGENPPGLDETIQLYEEGINLIVGHDYSLANRYSFEYANENNLLLLSPMGVGVGQSIPDDNLFKLTPNMYENPEVYDRVYARMIKEQGYEAFVTINKGKHCINRNLLDETAEALSYSYEGVQVEMDINSDDFNPYIELTEEHLERAIDQYGEEKVCILVEPLWMDDLHRFLNLADRHPILGTVSWYDFGGISEEAIVEEGLAPRIAKYGYIQLIMSPSATLVAEEFYKKYEEKVGPLPIPARMYGEAARYDAMWLMAHAVIEANSTDTEDVKSVLPQVCRVYQGVIGNCTLNEYGDRISADYDVYRWIALEGMPHFMKIGHYDSMTKNLRMQAQPFVQWNCTYGGSLEDVGLQVLQTADEGYIIAGLTKSFGEGEHDIYVIRTDSSGNKIWEKTIGGRGFDIAYSIQQCSDSGYIITGITDPSGLGHEDAFLLKIGSNGDNIWMNTYGNTGGTSGRFVQITSDDGYIIAGSQWAFGSEGLDFLLIRTDSDGTILWNRTYDGKGRDLGRCVQQTSDGGFIVTGVIDSLGPPKGMYLFKVDQDGSMLWNQSFGGDDQDAGLYVQQTSDGGYIVTGYTRSFGYGADDAYLVKTDSNGIEQWSTTIGGPGYEKGSCVQETANGDYVVSGTSSSFGEGDNDVFLFEVDANGVLLWNVTFGGLDNDGGAFVQQTIDGGYIVSGYTQSFGKGDSDVFLVKYSPPVP
jgi:ABC-type branched-subunit amino acid transport system substrate-binding protein